MYLRRLDAHLVEVKMRVAQLSGPANDFNKSPKTVREHQSSDNPASPSRLIEANSNHQPDSHLIRPKAVHANDTRQRIGLLSSQRSARMPVSANTSVRRHSVSTSGLAPSMGGQGTMLAWSGGNQSATSTLTSVRRQASIDVSVPHTRSSSPATEQLQQQKQQQVPLVPHTQLLRSPLRERAPVPMPPPLKVRTPNNRKRADEDDSNPRSGGRQPSRFRWPQDDASEGAASPDRPAARSIAAAGVDGDDPAIIRLRPDVMRFVSPASREPAAALLLAQAHS